MTRARSGALILVLLAGCSSNPGEEEVPSKILPESTYEARCAMPRTGTDPDTGQKFVDQQGSVLDEELWVRSWTDDTYLWYSEVPALDLKSFDTAVDYFTKLKTNAVTASGKQKDQFHFTYETSVWNSLSGSGVEAGYGIDWALISAAPPRKLVVALVQPGSIGEQAGFMRGTDVVAIDGVNVVDGSDTDTLNAGISPATGETHTFLIQDPGAETTHTVMVTAGAITLTPVQGQVLPAPYDKVGYLLFTDHIATSEAELVTEITALQQAGVTDLVLDLRYNGGGLLDIASELAYMIAGPTATAGKTFDRVAFNDKYPTTNPVTGGALTPTPFIAAAEGFSAAQGTPLPHLDLTRLFVLTGPGTCSASEAVLNGLAGIDIQIIQIGDTTCGKPYGFYPADNCGTTYFAIQFQGVNNKGFGDYADGFTPGGVFPGCAVDDDFTAQLGDPAEARLAAALAYHDTGSCPVPAANAAVAHAIPATTGAGAILAKPLWRQNSILRR
jgi:C-terminal processing protease CtpA/Prc